MLRDYVDSPRSAQEIGDLLTMAGFELEEITEADGEPVLDVNIMANRGDGASVIGMARELIAKDPQSRPTALFERAALRFPRPDTAAPSVPAKVDIQSSDCGRYACRIFVNLTNGDSPEWLRRRLTQIGQRPISLLVDLTNYVMIETGQPLHAFDLDKLPAGEVVIRQANAGEKLTTLDGNEHELRPDQMMICDATRPIAVAGVMGGLDTEVSATTTRCLLESAHFDHQSVRRTRKQLGLQTEASYRFERYVDPDQVVAALNRFADLLAQSSPEATADGLIDVYPSPRAAMTLKLRMARTVKLLGMAVSRDEAKSYLTALGFGVNEAGDDEFAVTPPSWRNDVLREDDLIEEIGRIHGYEKIPEADPIGSTPAGGAHGFEAMLDKVREVMLRAGYDQMMTFTLRDVHPLDAPGERIRVRTPHSPEIALLRNCLLPSLADSFHRNGIRDLHLFEIGRVFPESGERTDLAIMSSGRFESPSWRPVDESSADFFTVRGAVEQIARSLGAEAQFSEGTDERFHPTRQASIRIGGVRAGTVGQIHPDMAEAAELPADTVMADVNLSALADVAGGAFVWRPVSRHPATRRDIAIVIPKTVAYADLDSAIRQAGGEVLERHWLFDVYEGKGIPEGSHSLAFAVQMRKADSTFTDEEANQVRDAIVAALVEQGAQPR